MKQISGKIFTILHVTTIFAILLVSVELRNLRELYEYKYSTEPSLRVIIHYTTYDGGKYEMHVYDNDIDVGNDAINAALTETIASYRKEYMVCPCHPPEVTIIGREESAMITIMWPGEVRMFSVRYD